MKDGEKMNKQQKNVLIEGKLKVLNNLEVTSQIYGDVVMVKGEKVFCCGEVIDTLDTPKKINELWKELMEEEGF
jgi:hypothetical protein